MAIILVIAVVVVVVAAIYFNMRSVTIPSTEKIDKEKVCTDSGGTVTTSICCASASDFPNQCLIGACGCSAENSHQVKICDCGAGKCFNGTECLAAE